MQLARPLLVVLPLVALSIAGAAQTAHGKGDRTRERARDLHPPETGVGTVEEQHKLPHAPGFADSLDIDDWFGSSVTSIGDLDDDGVVDLAVGATGDSDGAAYSAFEQVGAVWVLFMDANGSVRARQKINALQGGFAGDLEEGDGFGFSLAGLGDLDGDGVEDLAVGAIGDDDGAGINGLGYVGAVWILFLRPDGTVRASQKISATHGGFTGTQNGDVFGNALAVLDDLDGDGTVELAVGAGQADDGGPSRGAVWVLFLNTDGTVKAQQKISATEGGFGGALDDDDRFGSALAAPGDLDGDGVADLCVGAVLDDDGSENRGAVWVLLLNQDGTVKAQQKISSIEGGFTGSLDGGEFFGGSLGTVGDLDGDGVVELAVGAANDSDGGASGIGAVWVLFMNADGTVAAQQKISQTQGGLIAGLERWDSFGCGVVGIGDLDGDGVRDLAVGSYGDDDGGEDHGAAWVLHLHADGTVRIADKISDAPYSLQGTLEDAEYFGTSVALLGDVDGDGIGDLAVGAPYDDDGATGSAGPDSDRGAVWILFLNADGSAKGYQLISSTAGSFFGVLQPGDYFGSSLAAIGDLDFDGITELAVGSIGDDDGAAPTFAAGTGAIWILFLASDGTVKRQQKISDTRGGFAVDLQDHGVFGASIAGLGDLDGDQVNDVVVGSTGYDLSTGALWVLYLHADGTVKSYRLITQGEAGFSGPTTGSRFGSALALLPGSPAGKRDLVVGASNEASNQGGIWLLRLDATGTVLRQRKIAEGESGFDGDLHTGDFFGAAVVGIGDLDGNGIGELAVGAPNDDNGGAFLANRGAVWILFLDATRHVIAQRKIASEDGGFVGLLTKHSSLGYSLSASPGGPLWAGAPGDRDEGFGHGAVWSFTLEERP